MFLLSEKNYAPRNVIVVPDTLPRVEAAPPPATSDHHIMLIGGDPSDIRATYDDIKAIPTPEPTMRKLKDGSYVPSTVNIPFAEGADVLRDKVSAILGVRPCWETYALAGKNKETGNYTQCFGRLAWPDPTHPGRVLATVFRTGKGLSYEISGFALGRTVCTNMLFPSDGAVYKLRKTRHVGERVYDMVSDYCTNALSGIEKLRKQRDHWQTIAMGDDLFYAYVGILLGRGMITSTMATGAVRYYHAIRAARDSADAMASFGDAGREFAAQYEPRLLSGYQAVSAAVQNSQNLRNSFRSYVGVAHVTNEIAKSGGGLSEIGAWSLNEIDYDA